MHVEAKQISSSESGDVRSYKAVEASKISVNKIAGLVSERKLDS